MPIRPVRLLQIRLESLNVCHSRMPLAGIYNCVAVDSR